MDTSLLKSKTIRAIYAFEDLPVHDAWINELTTPIATSMAVVELHDESLIIVAPREIEVVPKKYPSLGLEIKPCERSVLRFESPNGKIHFAQPLIYSSLRLPFEVLQIYESDPLQEGAVSEIRVVGEYQEIIFRHIMPPMTLGIKLSNAEST